MKVEIKVPAMGESVVEAGVGKLLKPSGSSVKENDEIVELETEKVNQVLYAPASGTLSWTVKEGDQVKIGEKIGEVDTEGVQAATEKPAESKPVAPSPKPSPTERAPEPTGGRLSQKEWVEEIKQPQAKKAEKPPAAAPSPVKEEKKKGKEEENTSRRPLSQIRRTIAKRLVESIRQSAMLTTFNEVDLSAVLELRARHQENFQKKHGVKLGFMSFFVKAVVEGLKAFPMINSFIDGEDVVEWKTYDISIAVSTDRGLVVPVLHGCDRLSFAEIEKRIQDFAKRAREGKLTVDELKGGNFTITNGGVYGSLLSTPILNPPQSGILGMHKMEKRAVVVNDEIVIRPMMYVALSYDHRLVDGKEAVSFLVKVKEVLEDPSLLLFDGE